MKYVLFSLKNKYTPQELAMVRYFYLSIFYEVSKFLLLYLFYCFMGEKTAYLISIAVLLSVRNFFGGIHFRHYSSCLAFTFIFTHSSILLSHAVEIIPYVQTGILFLCMVTSCIIRPITSKSRPPLTAKQRQIYTFCGFLVMLAYVIFFALFDRFPYRNLCFWVIFLQTLQLIAAKIINKKGDILYRVCQRI